MADKKNSERRTLVLTGASRGIGHATVKRFSSAGWRVITCSRRAFPEDCPNLDLLGNNNGRIDPQDLILNDTYADGVDDDANGYIDDISGWDFFYNDNDPLDDTRFGHGNGEAALSARLTATVWNTCEGPCANPPVTPAR